MPAFLLIGWGHSLPMLGLGLLLYSFGEWACRAGGGAPSHSSGLTDASPCPLPAAAVVVPCLSSLVAGYGKSFQSQGHQGGSGWQAPDEVSPQALQDRRALSWALCGAWVLWPGRWGPWWLPQVRARGQHQECCVTPQLLLVGPTASVLAWLSLPASPQCTGWPGPRSASACARGSSCSPSSSC